MEDGTPLSEEHNGSFLYCSKQICSCLQGFSSTYNIVVLSKKNFKLLHLFAAAAAVVAAFACVAAANNAVNNSNNSSSNNYNCNKRHHINLYETRRPEAIKLYSNSFAMKFII